MNKELAVTFMMLVSLLPILGCTSSSAHVHGTVTLDSKAAKEGYVTFRCVDEDRPTFIANFNIENGQYNSRSTGTLLPFGNYQVRVAVTQKTGRQVPLPGRPDNKMHDELIVISSTEYNSPQSPLNYDHAGTGTFDIDVPSQKP